MQTRISAVLFLSLLIALALLLSTTPLKETPPVPVSILGKWRVIGRSSPSDEAYHTYEFLSNGLLIEKFRSPQLVGQGADFESVEMDGVCTSRYRLLSKNRYRFFPIKCVIGGSSDVGMPGTTVVHVRFKGKQAVKYDVWSEGDQFLEYAMGKAFTEDHDYTQREREVWERIP